MRGVAGGPRASQPSGALGGGWPPPVAARAAPPREQGRAARGPAAGTPAVPLLVKRQEQRFLTAKMQVRGFPWTLPPPRRCPPSWWRGNRTGRNTPVLRRRSGPGAPRALAQRAWALRLPDR